LRLLFRQSSPGDLPAVKLVLGIGHYVACGALRRGISCGTVNE